MTLAFEKLLVYQKSVDFADQVCDLTEQFPSRYNQLADQVNRASLSIASNIAEGNGRFTKPDRKHFFGIARGSLLNSARIGAIDLRNEFQLNSSALNNLLCSNRSRCCRIMSWPSRLT